MTARTPYQPGGGDVSATLGELERKLRALEQELNATARPGNGVPATPQPDATPAADAPAPAESTPAWTPTSAPPPGRDADTLIAQARARLGTLDSQVDELLRFREQLQRTARELEEEYSRVLARIGAPASAAAPPAGARPAPATPPAAPAPPPAATDFPPAPPPISAQAPPPAAPPPASLRAPIAPQVDEAALLPNHPAFAHPEQTLATPVVAEHAPQPVAPMHHTHPGAPPAQPAPAPGPPTAQPPTAGPPAAGPVPTPPAPAPAPVAAPTPPPAPPVAASPHEDTLFEGAIVLDAGPFTDIATLSAFEQGLAHVPGAEDVYVSGFEGNRALVEVRLAHPVALVREMRQTVPAQFTVTDAAAGRLRLDVTAIAHGS